MVLRRFTTWSAKGDASQRFVSNVHVARFLVRHDRAAEAVPIFETALAVGEAVHGPDHEWIKGVREMYEEALGQP